MSERAIFQATFVKMVQVQGRKVFQFVFEVPTEAAGHALRALGGPEATINETWVAIARLDPKAVQRDPGEPDKAKFSLTRQSAIACEDMRFCMWLQERGYPNTMTDKAGRLKPKDVVHQLCQVKSRAEFDKDPAAGERWKALWAEFQMEDKI